jgi:hypothetical protein
MKTPDAPECEKLSQVAPISQKIGEFVDWLRDEKKISLAVRHDHTAECDSTTGRRQSYDCGFQEGDLFYAHADMTRLLAEFFNIDLNKVEEERRAILESLRRAG